MNDPADRWPEAGRIMRARMAELGLEQKDLVAKTGLSRETIGPVVRGRAGNYRPANLSKIARALDWTHDSIDRILVGLLPVERELGDAVLGYEDMLSDATYRYSERLELLDLIDHDDPARPQLEVEASQMAAEVHRLQGQLMMAERRLEVAMRGGDPELVPRQPVDRLDRLEEAIRRVASQISLDLSDLGLEADEPTPLRLAAKSGKPSKKKGRPAARPKAAPEDQPD